MESPLGDKDRKLLEELEARDREGSSPLNAEELEQMFELKRRRNAYQIARKERIEKVREQVADLAMEPLDIFTVEQLKAALGEDDLPDTAHTDSAGQDGRDSSKQDVLFELHSTRGRKFEYRKGRVYESPVVGKPLGKGTPWLMTLSQFPQALRIRGGDRESILEACTPAGKRYFKTKDGEEELEAILQQVREIRERFPVK